MSGIQVSIMLLGGIALFIFSLQFIEEAVKLLAGRSFKLFMLRMTKNKVLTIAGSALLAAVLQGSSVIMILVLSMVGTGVLTMGGALAFILGANIGTTFDSWLVAMLGFKMNISAGSYLALIIAAILQLLPSGLNRRYFSRLLFGFGLLFISISIMKISVEEQLKHFDFSLLEGLAPIYFVVAGIVITFLIQSSLATVTLSLSAIHTGAIGFEMAAAIVIGAEVGTTIKLFFGTLDGLASKKRLALGNFIINLITSGLALIFLPGLLFLIREIFGISDPLIGLVTLQSLINMISVLLFLPFLKHFAGFLNNLYRDSFKGVTSFISKEDLSDPTTALELFEKEVFYFFHVSLIFNKKLFGMNSIVTHHPDWIKLDELRELNAKDHEQQYLFIKDLQGELQLLFLNIRNSGLNTVQIQRLEQLISSVRSIMHASKSAKDVSSNIHNLYRSSNDAKFDIYSSTRHRIQHFYTEIEYISAGKDFVNFDQLKRINNEIISSYEESLQSIYTHAAEGNLNSSDFTTIMNFNREMFTSNKAMLFAVKDLLLIPADAERFNELPVYKS